jgi:N-acetylglucosamine-6-phosphate deacetylase
MITPGSTPEATGRTMLRGRAVLPDGLAEDARIEMEGGRIRSVEVDPSRGAQHLGEGRRQVGPTIMPGMLDAHVHGAGGNGVMDGTEAIRLVARFLGARGITAFLPTAVSAPLADLARFAGQVAEAREAQATDRAGSQPVEAEILGAHLEGPCLAASHRGVHDPTALVPPTELLAAWKAEPERWSEVRVVTLAPEQPGGMELIGMLAASGRIASVGHTAATYEQAWAAYEAGARSTTHLFNRMTPLEHRAPGTVAAALTHPQAAVELIADGIHVLPAVWPIVWHSAGDRLMLVSDGLAAAGLGDGRLMLGSMSVEVRHGRATLADGTLAGSTTLLDGALRNVIRAGLDLVAASRAASGRAADLLGASRKGRIEAGADADLLLIEDDGTIRGVMIGGGVLDEEGWAAVRAG